MKRFLCLFLALLSVNTFLFALTPENEAMYEVRKITKLNFGSDMASTLKAVKNLGYEVKYSDIYDNCFDISKNVDILNMSVKGYINFTNNVFTSVSLNITALDTHNIYKYITDLYLSLFLDKSLTDNQPLPDKFYSLNMDEEGTANRALHVIVKSTMYN